METEMVGKALEIYGDPDNSTALLAVILGSVTFIFALVGAFSFGRKGKSAVQGFFHGIFTGIVFSILVALISGTVANNMPKENPEAAMEGKKDNK